MGDRGCSSPPRRHARYVWIVRLSLRSASRRAYAPSDRARRRPLVLAVAERRRAEQNRHAAAVFAKYSFSRGLTVPAALSSALAWSSASVPFGGVSSLQRSRPETRSSRHIRHIEKGFVCFDDPALKIQIMIPMMFESTSG